MALVRTWARSVIRRNIARDRHLPVRLAGIEDRYSQEVELGELATGAAFEVKGSGRLAADLAQLKLSQIVCATCRVWYAAVNRSDAEGVRGFERRRRR